jgi:hypothetical protein
VFPETPGVTNKDITPRMGLAPTVRNGRTAVKFNIGKYLEGMGLSNGWANAEPDAASASLARRDRVRPAGVTRAWTDANGKLRPGL